MTKPQTLRPVVLLSWLVLAPLWMLIVILLTTLPSSIPPMDALTGWVGSAEVNGVVGHFNLFSLLTLLLWQALRQYFTRRQALLMTMLAVLLLGTTTELFQWFVAGRMSTMIDLLTNWLGAFAAGFLLSFSLLRQP